MIMETDKMISEILDERILNDGNHARGWKKYNDGITKAVQVIKEYQSKAEKLPISGVSGSLHIADAREMAKNVYAKITSYANYEDMNGIENTWIIECIAEGLVKASKNYR